MGNESVKATAVEQKRLIMKGKTSPMIHKFRLINWETMHLQNYERDIKNGLEKVLKIKI